MPLPYEACFLQNPAGRRSKAARRCATIFGEFGMIVFDCAFALLVGYTAGFLTCWMIARSRMDEVADCFEPLGWKLEAGEWTRATNATEAAAAAQPSASPPPQRVAIHASYSGAPPRRGAIGPFDQGSPLHNRILTQ